MNTVAIIALALLGFTASMPSSPRFYSAEDVKNLALFSEHLERQNENDILDGETNVRIGRCKYLTLSYFHTLADKIIIIFFFWQNYQQL